MLALLKYFFWVIVASACVVTSPLTWADDNHTKNSAAAFNAKEAFSLHIADLRTLMLNLYECQPQDLQKSTKVSKEEFVQWVFEGPFSWQFDTIKNVQSIEALTLSFSQAYQGDRILPLITGLYTMLLQAYGGKNEYTFAAATPQKLSIAAQNIAISAAKLSSKSLNNVADCHTLILSKLAKRVSDDSEKLDTSTQINKLLKPPQPNGDLTDFLPL